MPTVYRGYLHIIPWKHCYKWWMVCTTALKSPTACFQQSSAQSTVHSSPEYSPEEMFRAQTYGTKNIFLPIPVPPEKNIPTSTAPQSYQESYYPQQSVKVSLAWGSRRCNRLLQPSDFKEAWVGLTRLLPHWSSQLLCMAPLIIPMLQAERGYSAQPELWKSMQRREKSGGATCSWGFLLDPGPWVCLCLLTCSQGSSLIYCVPTGITALSLLLWP